MMERDIKLIVLVIVLAKLALLVAFLCVLHPVETADLALMKL